MAGQNLVDGVVDDLVDHVVQTRPVVGVADVHAGAFADRVEPLQHLDAVGAVVVRRRCFLQRLGVHFWLSLGTEFSAYFIAQIAPERRINSAANDLEKMQLFQCVGCDRLSLFAALMI